MSVITSVSLLSSMADYREHTHTHTHTHTILLLAASLLPYSHRNTQVRKTTSKHICVILEMQGPTKFLHSPKDLLDRTLPAIVQFASDSSAEPRYYGKRCLHQLWPLSDFERISTRTLSAPLLSRAKEIVESLRTKVSVCLNKRLTHIQLLKVMYSTVHSIGLCTLLL